MSISPHPSLGPHFSLLSEYTRLKITDFEGRTLHGTQPKVRGSVKLPTPPEQGTLSASCFYSTLLWEGLVPVSRGGPQVSTWLEQLSPPSFYHSASPSSTPWSWFPARHRLRFPCFDTAGGPSVSPWQPRSLLEMSHVVATAGSTAEVKGSLGSRRLRFRFSRRC